MESILNLEGSVPPVAANSAFIRPSVRETIALGTGTQHNVADRDQSGGRCGDADPEQSAGVYGQRRVNPSRLAKRSWGTGAEYAE